MTYSSNVNPGERLTDVVNKEIKELMGTNEWELLRVFDGGTDFDGHGNELVKYSIVMKVSYFDTARKQFRRLNNAYMSWVDEKKIIQ